MKNINFAIDSSNGSCVSASRDICVALGGICLLLHFNIHNMIFYHFIRSYYSELIGILISFDINELFLFITDHCIISSQ